MFGGKRRNSQEQQHSNRSSPSPKNNNSENIWFLSHDQHQEQVDIAEIASLVAPLFHPGFSAVSRVEDLSSTQQVIQNTKYFILFLTPSYANSWFALFEFSTALVDQSKIGILFYDRKSSDSELLPLCQQIAQRLNSLWGLKDDGLGGFSSFTPYFMASPPLFTGSNVLGRFRKRILYHPSTPFLAFKEIASTNWEDPVGHTTTPPDLFFLCNAPPHFALAHVLLLLCLQRKLVSRIILNDADYVSRVPVVLLLCGGGQEVVTNDLILRLLKRMSMESTSRLVVVSSSGLATLDGDTFPKSYTSVVFEERNHVLSRHQISSSDLNQILDGAGLLVPPSPLEFSNVVLPVWFRHHTPREETQVWLSSNHNSVLLCASKDMLLSLPKEQIAAFVDCVGKTELVILNQLASQLVHSLPGFFQGLHLNKVEEELEQVVLNYLLRPLQQCSSLIFAKQKKVGILVGLTSSRLANVFAQQSFPPSFGWAITTENERVASVLLKSSPKEVESGVKCCQQGHKLMVFQGGDSVCQQCHFFKAFDTKESYGCLVCNIYVCSNCFRTMKTSKLVGFIFLPREAHAVARSLAIDLSGRVCFPVLHDSYWKSILKCDVLVALVTPSFASHALIQRQVYLAEKYGKPIVYVHDHEWLGKGMGSARRKFFSALSNTLDATISHHSLLLPQVPFQFMGVADFVFVGDDELEIVDVYFHLLAAFQQRGIATRFQLGSVKRPLQDKVIIVMPGCTLAPERIPTSSLCIHLVTSSPLQAKLANTLYFPLEAKKTGEVQNEFMRTLLMQSNWNPFVTFKPFDFLRIPRELCGKFHPGTREWILAHVADWTLTEDISLLLLIGPQGVGKSVILSEVTRRANPGLSCQLGGEACKGEPWPFVAVHFFSAFRAEESSLAFACWSLSLQLRALFPHFPLLSWEAVQQCPPALVFKHAIIDPCRNLKPVPCKKVLLILDALDECEEGEQLLLFLEGDWAALKPNWLMLFASTRPLDTRSSLPCFEFKPLDPPNREDLQLYFQCVNTNHLDFETVFRQSQGVFLYFQWKLLLDVAWSKTVVIQDDNANDDGSLDFFFMKAFSRLYTLWGRELYQDAFALLLLTPREPMLCSYFQRILGFQGQCDQERFSRIILQPLRGVMIFFDEDGVLIPPHQSLLDWLQIGAKEMDEAHLAVSVGSKRHHRLLGEVLHQVCLKEIPLCSKPWESPCVNDTSPELAFALKHASFHLRRGGLYQRAAHYFSDFQALLRILSQAKADQNYARILDDCQHVLNLSLTSPSEETTAMVATTDKKLFAPRLRKSSPNATLEDKEEAVVDQACSSKQWSQVKYIHTVLVLCESALMHDPRELAGQIMGRANLPPFGEDQRYWVQQAWAWIRLAFEKGDCVVGYPLCFGRSGLQPAGTGPMKTVFGKGAISALSTDLLIQNHQDGSISVWAIQSGACRFLFLLMGHTHPIVGAGILTDFLVSGSKDKTVKLWAKDTGECILTLPHEDEVLFLSVCAVSNVFVSGTRKTAVVYDHKPQALRTIMYANEGTEKEKEIGGLGVYQNTLAVLFPHASLLEIFDIVSGISVHRLMVSAATAGISLSRNLVAWWESDRVVVFDIKAGKVTNDKRVPHGISAVVLSPKENLFVVASLTKESGISIWDGTVSDNVPLCTLDVKTTGSLFMANSLLGLTAQNGIHFYDMDTLIPLGKSASKLDRHTDKVTCVDCCDHFLITGSQDQSAIVWDINVGTVFCKLVGHSDSVTCVKIFPNNVQFVVTGSQDHTARMWDISTGQTKFLLKGHRQPISNVACNEKFICTLSLDHTARLYNTNTGAMMKILMDHTAPLFAVDSTLEWVMTGSADCTARVWDSTSGATQLILKGQHTLSVSAVSIQAFLFATGSDDQTVCTWNKQAQVLQRVVFPCPVAFLSSSFEGSFLVTLTNGQVLNTMAELHHGKDFYTCDREGHISLGTNSVGFTPDSRGPFHRFKSIMYRMGGNGFETWSFESKSHRGEPDEFLLELLHAAV